jgi:hypothetical protein
VKSEYLRSQPSRSDAFRDSLRAKISPGEYHEVEHHRRFARARAVGRHGRPVTGAKSQEPDIVGTWNFVVTEVTASNGKNSVSFGETPKGSTHSMALQISNHVKHLWREASSRGLVWLN